MVGDEIFLEEDSSQEIVKELDFKCPKCGDIHQDEVIFLCNKCDSKHMLKKDGIYICPQCLTNGENFMCMNCDSKEVKLKSKI
jgi:hypothetical protein